ncbi:hypothetical protein [Mycolicibacterium mengxianglii]|uniref:hypothetical protein n=1 Tax=Mycolicibacterium mengxianglii TaxID=2736649 RepID=UPI0018EF183A|nr:hypothetical protein [Mycolicibacterium mengxianglii]
MHPLVSGLMAATLLLSAGCADAVEGSARPVPGVGDPAAFFAGAVPTYGQRVSAAEEIRLAYLRALRRVDVCGLVGRDGLARIGEIHSSGTFLEFDECDVDVKIPGVAAPRYISATVELAQPQGPEVGRDPGVQVREAVPGACEYLVPIDLAALPGAGRLPGRQQPHLRIGMVAEPDCAAVARVASALGARLTHTPLPVRDGAATYTTALAERDPCEVLAVLDGLDSWDIDSWDIAGGEPYRCAFGMTRGPGTAAVPVQLSLRPRVVDAGIDGRELVRTPDAEVYLDRQLCTALVFVGPPLRRRLGNGDLVDTGDLDIRAAIDVASGEAGCTGPTLVGQVAARAAALYR